MNGSKRNIVLLITVSIPFLFSSCTGDEIGSDSTIGNVESLPLIIPNGDEQYLNLESDYVFDQENLRTYDLYIPETSFSQLNEDPAAEEYVEGMLVFEGDTISPVGIRYKGSVGAFVGCVSGSDWFDPSGFKTCTKLSMKVKINWEGREERFFGLNKLQFHSMNNDPSQLHERLAYWIYREMGVKAPRSVHARLRINGQYNGLYAFTEQIDGRFVKENFDDRVGNLYKEIWPLNMNGQPFPELVYLNALKTNEDENPSAALMLDFGNSIAAASPSEEQSILEQFMDVEDLMTQVAVDRTIRHDDGPFHWYCFFGGCASHNFYWYEEPTTQKLYLIPWDMDNAFENILSPANGITPIADAWGEISNNCLPFQYLDAYQWSACCDKLTRIWSDYDELFQAKKDDLINGPLEESNTEAVLQAWIDQIEASTLEADAQFEDAISLAQWQAAILKLREQLEYARNH